MKTSLRSPLTVLSLLACFLATPALAQEAEPIGDSSQGETPRESFGEKVDVTVVELMIDTRDKKGNPVVGLTPADFEVLEDGKAVEILGIDYPNAGTGSTPTLPTSDSQSASGFETPSRTADWRFLIYVDGPLAGRRSVRRAMEILDERIEDLVRQGPVEVVLANPDPKILQAFTRDPNRIRKALEIASDASIRNELVEGRRSYIRRLDMRLDEGATAERMVGGLENDIKNLVMQEHRTVSSRLVTLSEWMAAYGDVPASAAIIVSDGFDVEPADFYINSSAMELDGVRLRAELQEYRVDALTDVLSRQLAATGWTGMMMSLGSNALAPLGADASMAQRDRFRSIATGDPGSASATSTVEHALEPLNMVAEQTGGELITNEKRAGELLDRLSQRPRLTYVAPRSRDGQVHRVKVRSTRPDIEVLTPNWTRSATGVQVSASKARRLLVMDSDAGELPVQLEFPEVGPTKSGGARRLGILLSIDINLLHGALEGDSVTLAITLGVDIPNKPPFTHQVIQQFTLSDTDDERWPLLGYQTLIEVPQETRRISVVVEEPKSGIWGGSVGTFRP